VIFSIFQQALFVDLYRFSPFKREVLPKFGYLKLKKTSTSFGAKPLSLSLSKTIVSNARESLGLAFSFSFSFQV
jgi:hypothetical protein